MQWWCGVACGVVRCIALPDMSYIVKSTLPADHASFSTLKPTVANVSLTFLFSGFRLLMSVDLPLPSRPTTNTFDCFFFEPPIPIRAAGPNKNGEQRQKSTVHRRATGMSFVCREA